MKIKAVVIRQWEGKEGLLTSYVGFSIPDKAVLDLAKIQGPLHYGCGIPYVGFETFKSAIM